MRFQFGGGDTIADNAIRLGIVLLCVLGVVLAIGILVERSSGVSVDLEASHRAHEYASYLYIEVEKPCRELSSVQREQCLDDARTEFEMRRRDIAREYEDLAAQQKSATWARAMGIAAAVGLLVSLIGMIMIYATLRETRRTATEAWRAANEAANSHMAFVEAERAILVLGDFYCGRGEDQFRITMKVINHGATVARMKRVCYSISPPSEWPEEPYELEQYFDLVIAPEKEAFVDVELAVHQYSQIYVSGFIGYQTLTLKDARTYFAYELDVRRSSGAVTRIRSTPNRDRAPEDR